MKKELIIVLCNFDEKWNHEKKTPLLYYWGQALQLLGCSDNGGRAHYIIESKVQWKPFSLATQQYPKNDWLGGKFPYTMTYAHGPHWVYGPSHWLVGKKKVCSSPASLFFLVFFSSRHEAYCATCKKMIDGFGKQGYLCRGERKNVDGWSDVHRLLVMRKHHTLLMIIVESKQLSTWLESKQCTKVCDMVA